jgi:hypothetical protein
VRILCVCDEGISRSPTIAARIRYRHHETLAVGVKSSTPETRRMLGEWCDRLIVTAPTQRYAFPEVPDDKVMVWLIPDAYPRPHNKELLPLIEQFANRGGL